ncbi:SDR family oxidoreductase [Solimonas marina]|uniref:SDR family oxidoreductase n=1 Tax=Solimonas marina TaxID=2714601 RepID=A0A969WBJ9_9GAMM|nr:SDR family oxidoreductase [Solimonas marina]
MQAASTSNDKVILITGCSSGIGRALAEDLLRKGCRVAATARRPETLAGLDGDATRLARIALDVDDPAQIEAAVRQTHEAFGRIDILINNAGYGLMAPLMEVDAAMLQSQLMTNTVAPLLLARAVAPIMRNQGGGVIATIASVSGIVGTPFAGAYCASKAAVTVMSDVLRVELAPFGIRVVTVQAGAVRSGFGDAAASRVPPLSKDSWYLRQYDAIRARAQASQGKSLDAGVFADCLNLQLLSGQPQPVIRLGPMSRSLPILKTLLPARSLDRIMSKRFGL